MIPTGFFSVLVVAAAANAGAQDARITKSAESDCAAMTSLAIEDVHITQAAAVQPTAAQRAAGRAPLCRVAGVIGAEIHFVALLPDNWNRRFVMGGGGGYVGAVDNNAQNSVNAGYATSGTDTGHEGSALTARWALHNDERQINFAYLAVHRTAEVTKRIIAAYYGSAPVKSYFYGCSNGGREGLVEAQRYPADFDGIVVMAPAIDFGTFSTSFIRNMQVQFPTGDFSKPMVTAENLTLLQSKILDACDAGDGAHDGLLEDPRSCHFSLASLPACPNDAAGADCLTRAQRAAVEQIYSPVRANGTTVYPGQPFGNEGSWGGWITGISAPSMTATGKHAPTEQGAFGTEFFKYFVFGDSTWDYTHYDLTYAAADVRRASTLLGATNTDLSAFTSRGGKLILAHGWSDPALNALATIHYYEAVKARDASADRYLRLYLLPGVLHCAGGTGCDVVDWYSAISDWVERGVAPTRISASKLGPAPTQGAPRPTVRTRPLCPYPQHASYSGSGSTDDEKNFVCK
jgi:hypothetical protein